MMSEQPLRNELLKQITALLDGGQAHVPFDQAVAKMPFDKQGIVPAGLPYSAWQLLEHLRITQRDILDFSDAEHRTYQALDWPERYWPEKPEPPSKEAWQHTTQQIRADRKEFEALLQTRELVEPFPWGDGQNLLREALLIADHNSYHIGELIAVRRLLGVWNPA